MQRIATSAHRSQYPNPISFRVGDVVTLGERDEDSPGWIRTRLEDGNEGWAPESLLPRRADGTAVATADYSACELNTEEGDRLEVLRELNGWFWARNETGAEGWVRLASTVES